MTREELLAALEIAPGPDPDPSDDTPTVYRQNVDGPPPSDTALKLDAWSRRRGKEAVEDSEILRPILDGQDRAELAAADFLAAAFEPTPTLAETCTDATRHRYMSELMECEEYKALHADTQLDAMASELAAGHFAQGWIKLAEKEKGEPGGPSDGEPGDEAGDSPGKRINALKEAAKALDAAKSDVDDLRDAQRSLGGSGATPGQTADLAATRKMFDRIKGSDTLRRIMQLAGRFRRLAQAKQRQKAIHGQDDVVGVELGNDIARLVPAELAALGDEDLELDALRRYLERGLMQRDYRGEEPVGRGPIVVVVDESGSMHGRKIEAAKAFALAMGWIAKHQRRWLCLVGFSGNCPCNCLAMPPGTWDQTALMDWLEHFYGGGSDRDVPLTELPAVWDSLGCPTGKTDIIQVTDAVCDVDRNTRKSFNDWKSRINAKYFTIVLGSHGHTDDIESVSDRTWILPRLDVESDAVQDLMEL